MQRLTLDVPANAQESAPPSVPQLSPEPMCLHELFETQVARTPDAVALISGERRWSYRALDRRANQWAHVLRAAGVGPEVLVGLCVERSATAICALLGIVKAGGAYLPLDPNYPRERLAYMAEDARLRHVVSRRALIDQGLTERMGSATVFDADREASKIDAAPTSAPAVTVSPENLAYVIYTSGSTGLPKGTQVPHRGYANLVAAQAECLGIREGQRVLQLASLSFDASIFEIVMALASGSTLCLGESHELLPGPALVDLMRRLKVSHITLPPSVLAALPETDFPSLEAIFCAGEALPASLVDTWAPGRRMFNLYGPTEATVWSTWSECRAGLGKPDIGHAVPGVDIHIVDPQLRAMEDGEAGELTIGGVVLARSYLDRPALSAERFVPDPFASTPGARLYRSGDLARRLPNRRLDFLGRIDHQVKIHGQRIELGEIEAVLDQHPQVHLAAATVTAEEPPRLAAYIVPVAPPGPTARELRDFLRRHLPRHMVPSSFTSLAEMPLSPNGKIDRKALPQPSSERQDREHRPLATSTEIELAALWAELLGTEDHPLGELSAEDDFFALGGHSLLAGRLGGRVKQVFGTDLSLAALFEASTLRELAAEIDRRRASGQTSELPPISRADRDGELPLSFPQERVWFLEQLAPGNIAYNSQSTIYFSGPFDHAVAERVFCELIKRHEVFRTSFPAVEGRPVQDVLPPFDIHLPIVDLRGLAADERDAHAEELIRRELQRPFDMLKPPLVRWILLRLEDEEHALIQVEHHFCHDGWSYAVLMREIKTLYQAFAEGRPSPLPMPPVQPVDYATWHRNYMSGAALDKVLDFWRQRLAGAPRVLTLPGDRPRPKAQSFVGKLLRIELPQELCEGLRELSRRHRVTLYVTMLSAFNTLLTRLSGQTDLMVGTAAANRRPREVEEMLGMLVNTIIIRSDLSGDPTFAELLVRNRDTTLEAFAYQDTPLDKLVEALAPERDLAYNPLFQMMFSFHDSAVPDLDFCGLKGRVLERHNGSAKSDLNIVIIPRAEQRVGQAPKEGEDGISVLWEYSTDLFDPDTIERMVGHYQTLLESAVADADQRISRLPMLTADETRRLDVWSRAVEPQVVEPEVAESGDAESGDAAWETLPDVPVHEIFETLAESSPNALAAARRDTSLTYGELDAAANRLAHGLIAHGVGPEVLVAVYMEPGPDWLVALLATLKAGGAYLPIDPTVPAERLVYMMGDAGVGAVVTEPGLRDNLPPVDAPILSSIAADGESTARPPRRAVLDNLAYVIYTSGSTGRPKGTELAHRGLANLVRWHHREYRLSPADRATQVASPAFDASVWEVWPHLASGGSLHFPDRALRTDPAGLGAWLADQSITQCFLPTPLAEALWDEEQGDEQPGDESLSLKSMLVGGDKLQRLPDHPLPYRLVNHYGPTENTVVATFCEVPTPGDGIPPIGRPMDGCRAFVLDSHLQQVPFGVPGELYLSGLSLARGYLGRAALTAQSFVPNPWAETDGERLYRTGDLVRMRPDGEIEFLGRLDNQVKVRGFRIELGEIEATLNRQEAVRQAVVLAPEDNSGRRQLVAFVEPVGDTPDTQALENGLSESLAEDLPDYMIPTHFLFLDELPLLTNGKLDRPSLERRATDHLTSAATSESSERVAPRNLQEHRLAEIWSETLGVQDIGVHDTFFALGGHSLLATRLMSRVRQAFDVELELSTLFERPTVASLAETIAEAAPAISRPPLEPAAEAELGDGAPLSFAQERLWFLDRLIPVPAAYHIARAFCLRGALDPDALERAFALLAGRHEMLRSRFTTGPGGHPVRLILPPHVPKLPRIDLRGFAAEDRPEAARRKRREESQRQFDLRRGPLWRATLLQTGDDEHELLLTFHHIIFDGWSMDLFLSQLGDCYAAALHDVHDTPPPPALGYGDFAVWQRRWLQGDALEALLDYWRRELTGAPAVLDLPLDRPRPALQSFRGDQVSLRLGPTVTAELGELGRSTGSTPFMVVLAAFGAFLGRIANSQDVVVGTPVAGRGGGELDDVVGLFVNTLALRLRLDGAPSFDELLQRTRETTLGALAHQDLPFEKLVEALRPERDLSHSPIFQVLFVFQDGTARCPQLPGLDAEPTTVDRDEAQFDLMLFTTMMDGDCELVLRYDRALFERTTVERLVRHLGRLLAEVAVNPQQQVTTVPLLTPAEHHMLVVEHNDTAAPVADPVCLHELFDAQAARTPEALAIDAPPETLTYGELARRSNRLARHLRELGAGPGTLVGVHCERSAGMLVAVLGVLKSGAAYVPLETRWPKERIAWIVTNEEIGLLVTQESLRHRLESLEGLKSQPQIVCLDRDAEALARHDDDRVPAIANGVDLAYIIFTSGSTGTPKGVAVAHQPAVNLTRWVNRTFQIGPSDRLLFITALSFDLSVYDIFGILAAGGTVRVATSAELEDPQALVKLLADEPITFWDSAPAALQRLVPFLPEPPTNGAPLPALRLVFLSGDWIPVSLPDRIRDAFPGARVISLGGATEATVWSNVFPIGRVDPDWPSIPYGRPITNARYHALDQDLQPCPIGVAGDLYITGGCLSMGYSRAPRRTALSYIPDPLSDEPGSRLYRTGDRVRVLPDGNLEFLGRLDNQVKVRGFRIELGEIEVVLSAHPGVSETVLLAREDTPGDQRLVAYMTPAQDGSRPEAEALRQLARAKLPDYMVPAHYEWRDAWPLTATGKLDRSALGPPTTERAAEPVTAERPSEAVPTTPLLQPTRPLRESLADIWQEVLGVDEVGSDENFFDLGGHSLLMIRVHGLLKENLGREIAVVDLFRYPTIAALAEHLGDDQPATAPTSEAVVEEARVAEPEIAIVGLAGRFPEAEDVDDFWRLLRDGEEAIRTFTDDELRAAGIDDETLADPSYVKARGALADAELFDADFFGYTPREAQLLDPQQRLFLECAWQALEHAGYGGEPTDSIGVYAGVSHSSYQQALMSDPDLVRSVGRYQIGISNLGDLVAPRVSYKLDLEGPSLGVQTACSTSLVALHQACLALRGGDCDIALAGGASVRAREVEGYFYEPGGIASPDGRVRAFDADAAGTVAGSGVGVVALKRLADAQADGDTIHAVIRASAVNNDGSDKVGFTAPSVEGQAKAIRQALDQAEIDPATIGYVETHGTATAIGDPIEVAGLTAAFSGASSGALPPSSCALGSVKTNIGHLDAAAGIAGLIKTVLALRHRELPPSLHFAEPNPQIDFSTTPFYVNAGLAPWPANGQPRRAGVSSFGIGGTNAHVILEEAPAAPPSEGSRPVHLLLLSAKTPTALEAATENLAEHLEAAAANGRPAELGDVAHTLRAGRRPFDQRRFVVCRDADQAVTMLRGQGPKRLTASEPRSGQVAPVFLFPGQGSQYVGMGTELYEHEEVFRRELDRCAELFEPHLGGDLRTLLQPSADAEELQSTRWAQPALFAVELALAKLWMSWGVTPRAMLGHSIGEFVAAYLAGVFTLEDAVRLVALRGGLMDALPPGEMLAVGLSEAELIPWLDDPAHGSLDVAAINGPAACVVSGEGAAIAAFAERLAERGLSTRRLHTSHAFHSAMMEPAVAPFLEELAGLELRPPEIPFVSNLTGTWITPGEATDPHYWARHLRSTVRFADGLATILETDGRLLLEVGPGRTLATLARQHGDAVRSVDVLTSLPHARDRHSDLERLLEAVGRLWQHGVDVAPEAVSPGRHRRVPLPTYPFERQRFGIDFEAGSAGSNGHGSAVHEETGGPRTRAVLPSAETTTSAEAPVVEKTVQEMSPQAAAIAAIWQEMLGVDVGLDDDFFELGGSSLLAVRLGARLRQELDIDVSADALLEAPTVGELAARVDAGDSAPTSCLVTLQKPLGRSRRPLFMVHQAGGQVYTFRALAAGLGKAQPVYGLRSLGLAKGEEPLTTIEDMAAHYLELMREVQSSGPYLLGGASMGGMVAFEMARQLDAAGEKIALLTLMDTPCRTASGGDQMPVQEDHAAIIAALARDQSCRIDVEELRRLPREERLPFALAKLHEQGLGNEVDGDQLVRQAAVMENNAAALYSYQPRPWDGRMLYFRAVERRPGDPPRPEIPWIELARGGTEVAIVPGNHMTMHLESHLDTMTERLEEAIRRAGGAAR